VRFIVSLPNWLLIGSLMVLLGCATDRTIEVKVSRVVVELSPSEGITAEVAQSMFYEVAARSGLLVQAPHRTPWRDQRILY
jgi:phosphate/sulfate permease